MPADGMDERGQGTGEGKPSDSLEAWVSARSPVLFDHQALRIDPDLANSRRIRYADITHMDTSDRGVAIATLREAILIARKKFSHKDAPSALIQALRARIQALPGGDRVLDRMTEIDCLQARRRPRFAVYGFAVLCLVAYVLQENDRFVTSVGTFSPSLVVAGEYWRLVSANFLHNMLLFPFHLGLNLFCVVIFGILSERVLGSLRTVVVMGISGVTAMFAAGAMGYGQVVGASGVAAGLAGALVSIELGAGRGLPVWWRIPRRLLVAALVVQVALDTFLPFVAGAAHLGGFVAGYLSTRVMLDGAMRLRPPGYWVRGAAAITVGGMLFAMVEAAPLIQRDPVALEWHGLRLLQTPDSSAHRDNELAWRMLTESEPTVTGVEVALALAERAASQTAWLNPDVLDTLAEALFLSGDPRSAVLVIDQAIAITGGGRYFIEQRRRFTGERAADDRPEPPEAPWMPWRPHEDPPLIVPDDEAIWI